MEFVRVLHIQHYDPTLRRFSSLAFKNSSGGGISVFDADCAVRKSGGVCQHIHRYYHEVSGTPPIYWSLPGDPIAASEAKFEHSPSTTGDDCHADLHGLSNNAARRLLLDHGKPARLRACQDHDIAVDHTLLEKWRREAKP